MNAQTQDLAAWLVRQGMAGCTQIELLEAYCQRLVEMGLPLLRVQIAQSAYHPKYGGIGFTWERAAGVSREEYERSEEPPDAWLRSPFFHMLKTGKMELRMRLEGADVGAPFPILELLRAQGATDYVAMSVSLAPESDEPIDPFNPTEGALLSWTCDRPGGFSEADMELVEGTLPHLALALKSAANRRMAEDLLGIYLGRDAGARVLSGEMQRGSLRKINATIVNFDLAGFTTLSEEVEAAVVIEMLNDYFGVAVSTIEHHGGHVLKFMGDGLLAMFDSGDETKDAAAALDMAAMLRGAMAARSRVREADGLPRTDYTLAIHAGDILYGNIGAETRLDFTVIGAAVNLTARLGEMHRALGRSVIVSETVARAAPSGRHDLVSLGRFMLRGVAAPQMLYTLHDGGPA